MYSPITRISTIRIFLVLSVVHKMIIHQMNVKTTFLNSDLEEEIYIDKPEDYIV